MTNWLKLGNCFKITNRMYTTNRYTRECKCMNHVGNFWLKRHKNNV